MVRVIGFKGWDQSKGKMMPSRLKATAGADFMNLVNLVECYWRIVELP